MRPVGRGDVIDDDLLGAAENGPLTKARRRYLDQYAATRAPRLPTDVHGGNPLSESLEDVWLRRPDAPQRRRGWIDRKSVV